jgi:predicted DNA-binding transcriptional regulator AlpA
MLATTRTAAAAILAADSTITGDVRKAVLAALDRITRGQPVEHAPAARLLRRREAAARLGCCPRTLDRWTRLGLLPRVRLPGFARASGIPEAGVAALIASHAAAPVAVHERPAAQAGS